MKDYRGHRDQRWGHVTYSQHFDDGILINFFELMGIEKPSFLDIGCHHPVNINNTYLMYLRGSRGVNVDANPIFEPEFKAIRPEDKFVCAGIGTEWGTKDFLMYDQRSGLNTFCQSEVDKIEASSQNRIRNKINVEIITINDVVEKYCDGKFPNLLSIDAEGMDKEIIKSADFYRLGFPDIICVETRRHETSLMQGILLGEYVMHLRMAENLFFVKQEKYGKLF